MKGMKKARLNRFSANPGHIICRSGPVKIKKASLIVFIVVYSRFYKDFAEVEIIANFYHTYILLCWHIFICIA